MTYLCCGEKAVRQVLVEEYGADERLELIKIKMLMDKGSIHEVDFAPMRLERDTRLDEMVPEALQVC